MSNTEATATTTDERAVRRARRQALIDAGVNPYPVRSTVTHHAAELEKNHVDLPDGESTDVVVSVAGRVRALRRQGKAAFIVIEDMSGQLQLFCRVNDLPEDEWQLLAQLDLGDIVGATGTVLRTRRGQLSVAPTHVEVLSKSLRPLPEKFHGLTDREVRYRQRYVDLIMNPEVRDVFRLRSRIVSTIRRHMEDWGYMEVETPILHDILGGANAKPFCTHYNALDTDCYLRIATELPLKRLLVGGLERVFELGRQFRNEGMDLTHNPEFTTMEAYCAYSDLDGMKELAQGLFQTIAREACGCEPGNERLMYQGTEVDLSGTWRSASLAEVVSEAIGTEVTIDTPVEELRALLDKNGLEWNEAWSSGRLLFELYDELGEKTLVNPTFVCDYPVEVSPLAKLKPEDPRLTDRFELVVCGHEYANAFSELNDPVDQEARFVAQMEAKRQGDEEAMEHDTDYIRALEYGMPPAGGIGFGIDRMIMLFADQPSIRDVLLFPQMRPEGGRSGAGQASQNKPQAGALLEAGLTREQAFELLHAHNKDAFHIQHAETLEGLLRYFAEKDDPQNVEFWGLVGLLHDLDWENCDDPAVHTVRGGELIVEAGGSKELVHAIQTHNSHNNEELPEPDHRMERVLFAVDELSGLIQAAVLMRPSRSVMDLELKSLKKKFKDRRFAAGCDRGIIRQGAELLGMELDELLETTIQAMRAIAPDRDTFGKNDENTNDNIN